MIHQTLASATAWLICSKFIRASSVHRATRPMTAMMTVRQEKRVTLAASACAVGVSSTRASRSSWSTVPRRPIASRVEEGRTTRCSMGAMEASCSVDSVREAVLIARSTPTVVATSARVWARSTRRDSSLEIVSPESQSSSQIWSSASSTTLEAASSR